MQAKKLYKVWIYDHESGCEQPIECLARNVREAKASGNHYIKIWNLKGASVTEVQRKEDEA